MPHTTSKDSIGFTQLKLDTINYNMDTEGQLLVD